MPAKQYFVKLSPQERAGLEAMLKGGSAKVRELTRARILLKAADGWSDQEIEQALDVSVKTCERVRQRFAQRGLAAALRHKEQLRRKAPRLDGAAQARLAVLACSKPPEGREHWTLQLLAGELVRLEVVEHVCPETVRQGLKKTKSNRG